jgi:hypothetical protein
MTMRPVDHSGPHSLRQPAFVTAGGQCTDGNGSYVREAPSERVFS